MASSTRVTRSKGESDGLSLPMKSRSTRRDATSGINGGTTNTSGQEHQQQMPTQMPHTTQSPETAPAEQTATAATYLPYAGTTGTQSYTHGSTGTQSS